MSNGWEDLPSISVTTSNPSVGPNGAPAPASSNEIGFIDGSGNLVGVSPSNPLPVDVHFDTVIVGENLAQVNSQTVNVGIGAAGAGTQRVAVSSDSSLSVTGNVTVVQPTGSNLHMQIDAGAATIGSINNVSGTVSLPTGASTSALQTSGNASLTSIDGKLNSLGQKAMAASVPVTIASDQSAVPVSAASLPLPSGAATSANQTNKAQFTHITDGTNDALVSSGGGLIISGLTATGIAPVNNPVSVSGIDGGGLKRALLTDATGAQVVVGEGVAGTPAGGVVSVQGVAGGTAQPISGTVTAALPVDVAPATQNITIVDSASTTTAQANGQNAITGSPTANSAASFSVSSEESVEVQVTGAWTGTLSSEVSYDNGTTWFTRGLKQSGSSYVASTFTQNFQGGSSVAGATNYRVRATAAITGTAIVKAIFSVNQASIIVSNPQLLRDGTTQSILNTIKAASTAAIATDTALVVAVSPNNGLALDASVQETNVALEELTVSQGSTTSGQAGPLIQGAVTTAAPAYTTAQTSPLSLNTAGGLRVDGSGVTQPVSGTVTVANDLSWGAVTPGTAGTKSSLAGMVYNSSLSTPTNGQQLAMTSDLFNNLNAVMPDMFLTGQAAQTATVNNILTATAGAASTDVINYRFASIQIVSTGTGGTFVFEGSNDNNTFNAITCYVSTSTAGTVIASAQTASASSITYVMPLVHRYLRVRIASTITGGNIQAFARISQMQIQTPTVVSQATAASLVTTTSLSAGGIVANTANTILADVASGTISVTTNSATISPGFGPNYQVNIAVTAGTFVSNTYSFAIQESSDTATNWYTVYTFPNILATGTYNSPIIAQTGNRIRYVQTVAGGAASITRAINRIQSNGSSALPYKNVIDLGINPTSTNSVTASLPCEGNNTYSAIVNQGAGGSPVNFAMDGSDDNSNWVSAIATCTGVVGGATPVAMYYSGVNYRFTRVRVVTGVAATTISYVSLSSSMAAHDLNQVVSGTVTANAGSGTFTVGQATGSNLHVQVDAGTANIGQVSAGQGTLTNRSGVTSGTPGTSTTVMSSNAARKYLLFQNLDGTSTETFNFTSAADTSNSISLAPGQSFVMEGLFVSTEAITVQSSGTSVKYVAKEG